MRGLDFVSWANQSKGNDEEEKPRISKAPMKSPSTRNKAQSLPTASIWKENLKNFFVAQYFWDSSIVFNISSFSLKLLQSNQWKFHYLILNFWSPHPHIFKIKPISSEAIMPKQYISRNLHFWEVVNLNCKKYLLIFWWGWVAFEPVQVPRMSGLPVIPLLWTSTGSSFGMSPGISNIFIRKKKISID